MSRPDAAETQSPAELKPLGFGPVLPLESVIFIRKRGDTMALLEVGSPAPQFEATDHTGKTVRLEDYRGKTLVLWFYPKADTPG